jgi:uncharacterized protein
MAQEPVASPCISICEMDTVSGLCQGCSRTIAEIAAWGQMSDPEKQSIWGLIAQRVAQRQLQEGTNGAH